MKPVQRLDPNPYLRSYEDKVLLLEELAFQVTASEIEERRGAEALKHSVLEELKNIFEVMKALSPVLQASVKLCLCTCSTKRRRTPTARSPR